MRRGRKRHRILFRNSEGNRGKKGFAEGKFAAVAERILAQVFEKANPLRQSVNPQVPGSSPGRGANLHWLAVIAPPTNVGVYCDPSLCSDRIVFCISSFETNPARLRALLGSIAVRRLLSLRRLLKAFFAKVSIHFQGALAAAKRVRIAGWKRTRGTDLEDERCDRKTWRQSTLRDGLATLLLRQRCGVVEATAYPFAKCCFIFESSCTDQSSCVNGHLLGGAGCGGDHENILRPRRAPSPTSKAADPKFHIRIMIVASNS